MIAINQVGGPRGVIGRRDDCIQVELADRGVDSVYSRVLIDVERLVVRDAEDWIDHVRIQRDRLRELEDVLVEEWQLNIIMSIVEVDRALKISVRDWHTHTRFEVLRDVTFEIVEQDEELAVCRRKDESLGIQINHYSTGVLQRLEGRFDRFQHWLRRRHERIKSI